MAQRILILGCNDMGSAVAHRLFLLGGDVVIWDIEAPAHPRRGMAFTDALFLGTATLDGVVACTVSNASGLRDFLRDTDAVAVTAEPVAQLTRILGFDVLVDARMRKRSIPEDLRSLAPMTLGLGPGLAPVRNCQLAIETIWGAALGDVLEDHETAALKGEPRILGGASRERFMYAEASGVWCTPCRIGQQVSSGEPVGKLDGQVVRAPLTGTLRGLAHDGVSIHRGQKFIEVDPRQEAVVQGLGERPSAVARGVSRALDIETGLANAFFGFEADYRGDLNCMPISMRMKLDRCGTKLSLGQWRGLPVSVRETLLEMPGETETAVNRLRSYLVRWVIKLDIGELQALSDKDNDLARATDSVVPGLVKARLAEFGRPIELEAWGGLSSLQRYAVVKLCRSKSARNLGTALDEFGLP